MGLIRRAKHSVGHRTDYPNRARARTSAAQTITKAGKDAAIVQAPEVWRKWPRPSLPPRPEAGAFAHAHNAWSLAVDNLRQGAGGRKHYPANSYHEVA